MRKILVEDEGLVARLLEESEREVVKLVPKPVEVVDNCPAPREADDATLHKEIELEQ